MWQLVRRRTEAGRDPVTGVSKCKKTCGVLSDRSGLGLWWLRQPLFSSVSSAELCTGVHSEVLSDESFRGPLVYAVAVQTLRDRACGVVGGAGDWKLSAGFHSQFQVGEGEQEQQ